MIKNETCLPVPVEHQLILTAAVAIGDQVIQVKLNPTYVASSGAYVASSSFALYPGTYLYFVNGAATEQYEVLPDVGAYNMTLTASTVRVQRSTVALPITATANTYLAAKLCVQKAPTTVNTTTQDNTTTCTGFQSTMINTAFGEVLDVSGFPNAADRSYYDFIVDLGRKMGSAFILKDSDRFSHETYLGQLTKASETGAEAKGLVAYALQIQIQNSMSSYNGKIATTPAQKLLAQAERRLWGADLARL